MTAALEEIPGVADARLPVLLGEPAIDDLVQLRMIDGAAGPLGVVTGLLGDGWIKVRVPPWANFAVAPGACSVILRAL